MSFLNDLFSKKSELNEVGVYNDLKVEKIKDPENENEELRIIRFGNQANDYFIINEATPDRKIPYIKDVLSKVVESPTQLAKIRAMPLEDRPDLLVQGDAGRGCAGWCNGQTICLCPSILVDNYSAAGTFCHEFQHQEQFTHEGTREFAENNNVVERMVNDRIYEAAADTAHYQYLYEVRHNNPKAFLAYQQAMMECPGMRSYDKAKRAGKPEQECILSGMMGYAKDSVVADYYAKDQFAFELQYRKDLDADRYSSSYSTVGRKKDKKTIEGIVMGNSEEPYDFVHAFKAHTIGMTEDTSVSDQKIKSKLRSPEMNYVASVAGRAIERLNKQYQKVSGGEDLPLVKKGFWIKNVTGLTHNRGKDGLSGLWFKAVSKCHQISNALRYGKEEKGSVACSITYYDKGRRSINLTTAAHEENASGTYEYQVDKRCERERDSKLSEKEIQSRNKKMKNAINIAMKDSRTATLLKYMPASAGVKFIFDEDVKDGVTNSKNEIYLNPKLSAFDLAAQIAKQARVVKQHQKVLKENPQFASYEEYVADLKQKDPEAYKNKVFDMELNAEAERGLFIHGVCDKTGLTGYYKVFTDPVAKACMDSFKKEISLEKNLFAGKQQAAKAWGIELEDPKKQEKQVEKVQEQEDLKPEQTVEKIVEQVKTESVKIVEPVQAEPVVSKTDEVKKPEVKIVQPVAVKPVSQLQEVFKTKSTPELQKKTVALKPEDALKIVDEMASMKDETFKPNAEQKQAIDFVAKYTNDAVQKAGVDVQSPEAKIERMKALAELTKTAEGKKAFNQVMSSYRNIKPTEHQVESVRQASLQGKISAKGPVVVPQIKTNSMQSNLAKVQKDREVRDNLVKKQQSIMR